MTEFDILFDSIQKVQSLGITQMRINRTFITIRSKDPDATAKLLKLGQQNDLLKDFYKDHPEYGHDTLYFKKRDFNWLIIQSSSLKLEESRKTIAV